MAHLLSMPTYIQAESKPIYKIVATELNLRGMSGRDKMFQQQKDILTPCAFPNTETYTPFNRRKDFHEQLKTLWKLL